jgi:hypothetical protein
MQIKVLKIYTTVSVCVERFPCKMLIRDDRQVAVPCCCVYILLRMFATPEVDHMIQIRAGPAANYF